MSSSRMTKDQLRDALAEIGVKTPAKMKKAELVKLYREKVLEQNVSALSPNDSIIGGFSSDEEEPAPLDTTHITDPADVQQLTNDEIFLKLKELGEHVGPILDSTRSIYERKLMRLLTADEAQNEPFDRHISSFSADEEDERELDKDETDEYEVVGGHGNGDAHEEFKSTAFSEKVLDNGAYLKTSTTFQDKVEHDGDGGVIRTRRAHTLKTLTSENVATNGKSFVPPPPKKRGFPLVGKIALVVLLVVAALVWFNLESGQHFEAVPSPPKVSQPAAPVPVASGNPRN